MPDIAMCNQPCSRRFECYRHSASGTEPSQYGQSYLNFKIPPHDEPHKCFGWEPVNKEDEGTEG